MASKSDSFKAIDKLGETPTIWGMKRRLMISAFAFLSFIAPAFSAPDEKVNVDLYEAKETAKKDDKLVLLVLTRKATCSLCVSFAKNVLDDSRFKAFAKKNLEIVVLEDGKDRKPLVKEKLEEQKKARKEFYGKYPEYKLLPGVFLINPKNDQDTFIKSPEVASMSAADFIKAVKKFEKDSVKKAKKAAEK